ncbi:MAG: flippase [Nitrospirae bacterium]|nr:flippase [Nitrospirota bacterium]
MRQVQRIAKNVVVLVGAEVIGSVLNLVTIALIARALGVGGFGRYSFVMAIVAVFQLVADVGVTNIFIREVATKKEELARWLGAAKSLVWCLSFLSFLLMVLAFRISSADPQIHLAGYIMGAAVLATFHAVVYNAVFRAFEEMEYNALGFTLHKILLLALVFTAITQGYGLIGIFTAYLAANLSLWVFFYSLVFKRHLRPRLRFDPGLWRTLLKESIPLGIGIIIRRIGWQADILILTAIGTPLSVGLFSAAYKIIQAVNLLPTVLAMPLFPVLSRLAVDSPQKLLKTYGQCVKIFCIVSLPIVVLLSELAPWIIRICFGPEFSGAAPALALLAAALLFLFPTALFSSLFTALGLQRLFTVSSGIALGINIVIDFLLIPSYGYIGACVGTLLAEITLFVIGSYYLARAGYRISLLPLLWRPFAAGAGMAALLLPVHWGGTWPLIGGLLFGGAGYLALLWVFKVFGPEEIELGMKLIEGRFRRTAAVGRTGG